MDAACSVSIVLFEATVSQFDTAGKIATQVIVAG
jgi:hypothetical protein